MTTEDKFHSAAGFLCRSASNATKLVAGALVKVDAKTRVEPNWAGLTGVLRGFTLVTGFAVVCFDGENTEHLLHPEALEAC